MNTSSGQTDRGRPAVRWQTAALWAGAGLGTLALSNLAFRVPLGVGDRIFAVGPLLAVIGVATGALLVRRAPLSTLALMLLGTYLMLFLGRAPALTLAMVLPAAVALGMVAATRSRRVTLSAVGITVLLLLTAQFALPVTGPARILTQSQLPIVVLAWLMGTPYGAPARPPRRRRPGPPSRPSRTSGCASPASCTTWSPTASA